MELTTMTEHVKVFPELDDAVEWIEDQILGQSPAQESESLRWNSNDLELFSDHKEETLIDLEACLERRSMAKDEKVYSFGDPRQRALPDSQGGGPHHAAEFRRRESAGHHA
ncbi:MAG: hypothetical protein V5B38_02505 [Candidatus Accumulibacter propinquus]|jgi:hypothetical protein